MKKLFCKLPPVLWASLLAALIASGLQTAAILLEYDPNSNYFTRDAILPTLAILFALGSAILGILSALIERKRKGVPEDDSSRCRKLHIFPAVGFFLAAAGLAFNLFVNAGVLWMYRDDGVTFLKEFLVGETKIAILCLPLLFCAITYCWNQAFPNNKSVKETVILGFATVIACAILGIHVYFDFSVEMNSPIKSFLQASFLCAMIFFTSELRLLLKKPLPGLLRAISSLTIAAASLCAIATPVAFLMGYLSGYRVDFFFYGLFSLCLIPAALEHLLALTAPDVPDHTERTDDL